MSEKARTCTICGLRPPKLPDGPGGSALLDRLEEEIRGSILLGFSTFQTGMAMGTDIWAAELVRKLRTEVPGLRLTCRLPCETQANKWPERWRERYFSLLAEADEIVYIQRRYAAGCVQRNTRAMLDASSRLIAVHDGCSPGGTAQAIRYAGGRGLELVVFSPSDCAEGLR